LDELERQNKSTALATLCVGGGMGIAHWTYLKPLSLDYGSKHIKYSSVDTDGCLPGMWQIHRKHHEWSDNGRVLSNINQAIIDDAVKGIVIASAKKRFYSRRWFKMVFKLW
jgi:hypothetical protein